MRTAGQRGDQRMQGLEGLWRGGSGEVSCVFVLPSSVLSYYFNIGSAWSICFLLCLLLLFVHVVRGVNLHCLFGGDDQRCLQPFLLCLFLEKV